MKKNDSTAKIPTLRLSPATSLKAIGSAAKRAAAIAAVEKIQQAEQTNETLKKGKSRNPLPKIELSVRNMNKTIEAKFEKSMVVAKEKPNRYATSYAITKLYDKEAYTKHKADVEAWVANGSPAKKKPKTPTPDQIYVFYPSVYEPDALGSVALYCNDSKRVYENVSRSRLFLGVEVRNVSLDRGVTQYVDVLFKK